jgi:Rrf2 family iron-sulfur cluster assembly transcriptional regulator
MADENHASKHPIALMIIADRQKISLSYLEQIFKKLRVAALVKSVRGPGGGYILSKKPNEITIDNIIEAIGEPVKITKCSGGKTGCMTKKIKCKTHDLWYGLEQKIHFYLGSITLHDICKK